MAKQKDDKRTPELPLLDLNVTAFLVAAATLPQFMNQQRKPGSAPSLRPGHQRK